MANISMFRTSSNPKESQLTGQDEHLLFLLFTWSQQTYWQKLMVQNIQTERYMTTNNQWMRDICDQRNTIINTSYTRSYNNQHINQNIYQFHVIFGTIYIWYHNLKNVSFPICSSQQKTNNLLDCLDNLPVNSYKTQSIPFLDKTFKEIYYGFNFETLKNYQRPFIHCH